MPVAIEVDAVEELRWCHIQAPSDARQCSERWGSSITLDIAEVGDAHECFPSQILEGPSPILAKSADTFAKSLSIHVKNIARESLRI